MVLALLQVGTTDTSLVGILAQYGAVGLLAGLAILAYRRADSRLQAITDRFLEHLEALGKSQAQNQEASIEATLKAAEAYLAVANQLQRIERAMGAHEKASEQRATAQDLEWTRRYQAILAELKQGHENR